MGREKPPKVETPMLRAYLREAKSDERYGLGWWHSAGWIVFVALLVIPGVDFWPAAIAGGLVSAAVHFFRRPKSEADRVAHECGKNMRRLASMIEGGYQRSHVPPEILFALEQAAVARHAALIRVAAEDPQAQILHRGVLNDSMANCLQAAAPTFRDDEQGRKEWEALRQNQQLMGAVLNAIQIHISRMDSLSAFDHERLAALRELDEELGVVPAAERG